MNELIVLRVYISDSSISLQADSSFMTFEGTQLQGAPKIMEKFGVSTIHHDLLSVFVHFVAIINSNFFFYLCRI